MIKVRWGFGLLFRPYSFWVGAHYCPFNKRLCVNLLPCFTLWFVFKNGLAPIKNIFEVRSIEE